MITLMFLTMLFGTVVYSIPGIITVGAVLYLVIVDYLLGGIFTCILQGKLKMSGKILNFIPVVRGINDGRIVAKMTGNLGRSGLYKTLCVLGHLIYLISFSAIGYEIYDNYDPVEFYYLREFANAVPDALESEIIQQYGLVMVIACAVTFFVLAVLKIKAMKGVGILGFFAVFFALFMAPYWAIITVIYLSTIGKGIMPSITAFK